MTKRVLSKRIRDNISELNELGPCKDKKVRAALDKINHDVTVDLALMMREMASRPQS
jgi:hypothetical protein